MEFVAYIILAVLILMMMITVHEFGHYISGKILKFKINEFSIGFGPKLFSRRNKKTGELFSIRAIPLGGYCAFEGEDGLMEGQSGSDSNNSDANNSDVNNNVGDSANSCKDSTNSDSNKNPTNLASCKDSTNKDSANLDSKKPDTAKSAIASTTNQTTCPTNTLSFNDQHPWKRIVVLLAGGVFNILSAIIFSFIFILAVGMEKPNQTIEYVFKDADGIAYNDLQKGDTIIEVDGRKLTYMYALSDAIANAGETSVFVVERLNDQNQIETITVTLKRQEIIAQTDDDGNQYNEARGFGFVRSANRDQSFLTALEYSVPYTGKMSWAVLGSLGKLVTGNVPLEQVTGPVGTVTAIAEYSLLDWRYILLLLPLLAANLGIFNLLPIPALDGSKIVFCTIEWIRKKPINRNVENMIHAVGLLLLFGFVIFVEIFGIFVRCGG